jgi:TfoX/Sxy family transcriptional regulator of competence genes
MEKSKLIEEYNKLIDSFPEVLRKGKTMPYTSLNGNMFSFISKEGDFGIRLSKENQAKYIEKTDADFLISHGAVMNGYIKVPDSIIEDEELLKETFIKSLEFAKSLKPKPTKKKK